MTATLTHVDTQSIVPPEDQTRAERREVIRSIWLEANASGVDCTRTEANNFFQMLEKAARIARREGVYHIEDSEIYAYHSIMLAVMPPQVVVADTGSAHEGINSLLTSGGELGLMHTADDENGVHYCAVAIVLQGV